MAFVIILDFLIHQTAKKLLLFCSLNNFFYYLLNNDVCLSVDLNGSILPFHYKNLPTACNKHIFLSLKNRKFSADFFFLFLLKT